MNFNVENESHIVYTGTNTDSMKIVLLRIELNPMFPFFLFLFSFSSKTRHFVVVKVKYMCKIMNLMLVTL